MRTVTIAIVRASFMDTDITSSSNHYISEYCIKSQKRTHVSAELISFSAAYKLVATLTYRLLAAARAEWRTERRCGSDDEDAIGIGIDELGGVSGSES